VLSERVVIVRARDSHLDAGILGETRDEPVPEYLVVFDDRDKKAPPG